MELRVLRYFLAIADQGSISAASEALHVTQPTLSRQIMELEKELKAQLFMRGGRKLLLTEEGTLLRSRAEEIIALADTTEHEFTQPEKKIEGDIRIGCGETVAVRDLTQAAMKLRGNYPGIKYHLFSGSEEDLQYRLDAGLLDFALQCSPLALKKYEFIRLETADTWGLVARRDSEIASKERVTPEDVCALPLILSRHASKKGEMADWLNKPNSKLNIVGTYNLPLNASMMVREGFGYAPIYNGLVDTSETSELCYIPFDPPLSSPNYLVWKKHRTLTRAAAKLLKTLTQDSVDNRLNLFS